MTTSVRVWAATMAVTAVLCAPACDSMPLLAPSGSSLAVHAAAAAVSPGGVTEVTAIVLEPSGTAVPDGTTVYFTTTLGTLTPATVETVDGIARTTFQAGVSPGVAVIRASSGHAGSAAREGTDAAVVEVVVG